MSWHSECARVRINRTHGQPLELLKETGIFARKKKEMIRALIRSSRTSLVVQTVKNTPTMWET